MFYGCNHFTLSGLLSGDLIGGRSHMLWVTRSADARIWTTPVPAGAWAYYYYFTPGKSLDERNPSQILRMADGRYAVLDGLSIIQGIGPGRFAEKADLDHRPDHGWPWTLDSINARSAAAIYDRDGHCHFISSWSTGDVNYCQPEKIAHLTEPIALFHTNDEIHYFRPVIDGKRLLLLYASDAGVFLRGGTIEAGRPKLGEAVPLPGLAYKDIGRQFFCHGGSLDLPIGQDTGSGSGGSGPRLLHGDFDKVFTRSAPVRD